MIKENNQIVLNAIQIDEYFIINGLGILQESKEIEFIFDDKLGSEIFGNLIVVFNFMIEIILFNINYYILFNINFL